MIGKTLGKSGMGEVWCARDSKLGREVAIKTLPVEFGNDEERLLGSLNHPNIATIHGLEEDGGTRFLVLELIEGDTLADRIKRGVIPLAESNDLGRSIREGSGHVVVGRLRRRAEHLPGRNVRGGRTVGCEREPGHRKSGSPSMKRP
jgi:serine/threonine protein kinase